ncbi:hypothetical protein [Oryzifoliimicrobium ureilyticus]|uniref:hypothetical protein n=1 Tax=Oryzifoliimicrobium ureilyticus TaxID=3113724 RepID=UPI00307662EE
MRNRVAAAVWASCAIFGAVVVVLIIFGEPRVIKEQEGGNRWRNAIYDFQTLAAGIFAVGAAYATVKQMQYTEGKSDDRHNQLVKLNTQTEANAAKRHHELVELTLRPDKLLVERAVNPQVRGLKGLISTLDRLHGFAMERQTDKEMQAEMLRNHKLLKNTCDSVATIVTRQQLVDGSKMFKGDLTYELDWIRTQCERTSNVLASLGSDLQVIDGSEPIKMTPQMAEMTTPLLVFAMLMPKAVRDACKLMEEAATEYGVVVR